MKAYSFVARSAAAAIVASCIGATPVKTDHSMVAGARGHRELNDDDQAIHVLNRLAFGPRPGDVESVRSTGVDAWIDRQLHPERINDDVGMRVLASYGTLGMTSGELLREYPPPGLALVQARLRGDSLLTAADSARLRRDAARNRRFTGELLSARVARAVESDRQLQEVMSDFWLNHFSVFVGKGQIRYYLGDYEREAIRPHALGKFRELLGAVAKSPAMLLYLDNAQSVADSGRPTLAAGKRPRISGRFGRRRLAGQAPQRLREEMLTDDQRARLRQLQARRPKGLNENYARELLELHTLGVDGGYSQRDVIEVARALTGWTVRPPRLGEGTFFFNPVSHDAGPKTVLGHKLAADRGIQDGEQVLDIVARHPATSRFIARKLAIRFVSDSPPPALIERAATVFRRTDGDIREVVRTIVTSPEFFSRAAYRSKVKSPFEVVVSTMRALGGHGDTTAVAAASVARLGEPIYGHQAPNGWPETGEPWMNTGAILSRINYGMTVATGRLPGLRLNSWPDYARLRRAPREEQVNGVIASLLGGEVSAETRSALLSGANPLLSRLSDTAQAPVDEAVDSVGRGGAAVGDSGMTLGPPPRGQTAAIREFRRNRKPANEPNSSAGLLRGPPPPVDGLAQIIGLALGAPEFQRH